MAFDLNVKKEKDIYGLFIFFPRKKTTVRRLRILNNNL